MSTIEVKRAIVSRPTEGEFLRTVGRIKITSEQTDGAKAFSAKCRKRSPPAAMKPNFGQRTPANMTRTLLGRSVESANQIKTRASKLEVRHGQVAD